MTCKIVLVFCLTIVCLVAAVPVESDKEVPVAVDAPQVEAGKDDLQTAEHYYPHYHQGYGHGYHGHGYPRYGYGGFGYPFGGYRGFGGHGHHYGGFGGFGYPGYFW